MLALVSARLNLPQLGADLVALDALLAEQPCLDEAGPRGLQQFFNARPNLVLLMSRALFDGIAAAAYLPGCSIMQEFYADFAIVDKTGITIGLAKSKSTLGHRRLNISVSLSLAVTIF